MEVFCNNTSVRQYKVHHLLFKVERLCRGKYGPRKVFEIHQQVIVSNKILLQKANEVKLLPESLVSESFRSRILPYHFQCNGINLSEDKLRPK